MTAQIQSSDFYKNFVSNQNFLSKEEQLENGRKIQDLKRRLLDTLLGCHYIVPLISDCYQQNRLKSLEAKAKRLQSSGSEPSDKYIKEKEKTAKKLLLEDPGFNQTFKAIKKITALHDSDIGSIDKDSDDYKTFYYSLKEDTRKLHKYINIFVSKNILLVCSLVNKNKFFVSAISSAKSTEKEDFIQQGLIGIRRAALSYDPEKNICFSTYATNWIHHEISRLVKNKDLLIRIPVHRSEKINKMNAFRTKFKLINGRYPTTIEISKELEVSKEEASQLEKDFLINGTLSDYSESPIHDRTDSQKSPGGGATISTTRGYGRRFISDSGSEQESENLKNIIDFKRAVDIAKKVLTKEEKYVLNRRFGINNCDELTLKEIGQQLKCSREKVRLVQNRALKKIREAM